MRNSITTLWMIWTIAAVALTFAVGAWLVYGALARRELAVDATLGSLLTPRLAVLLAVAWVPALVGALVGHRKWRHRS